jgi:aminomethyltransferase
MSGTRLPLHGLHVEHGAVFADRAGWQVPEHYGDRAAEYAAIREGAAIIDRSDRSRFLVTGTDAADVLEAVVSGHPRELEEGRALRAAILDGSGLIDDLVLVARTGAIAYLAEGEPGRRTATFARLTAAIAADFDARVDDRTETTSLITLAGPRSAAIAAQVLEERLPSRLLMMQVALFEFRRFRTLTVRTSDTGEDGFAVMAAPDAARHLVEELLGAGAVLAGRAAHEVGRVEAGIPAFEPDLAQGLTPAEADLPMAAGRFDAPRRRLAGLLLDGGEPVPPGTPVLAGGAACGEVRSCVVSPAAQGAIALAVIAAEASAAGTLLSVAGRHATVVVKPFLRRARTP